MYHIPVRKKSSLITKQFLLFSTASTLSSPTRSFEDRRHLEASRLGGRDQQDRQRLFYHTRFAKSKVSTLKEFTRIPEFHFERRRHTFYTLIAVYLSAKEAYTPSSTQGVCPFREKVKKIDKNPSYLSKGAQLERRSVCTVALATNHLAV